MGLFRRDKGPSGVTFQMRQKALSIGDDYWIEDSGGNKVFKVNGKALRIRDTFVIEDMRGNEVIRIQEKKLTVRDKMEISRDGHDIATVKKALVSIRDRFVVDVEDGEDLDVKGKLTDHEYKIERGGDKIAEVSKKWFRVRDTYGVEIDPNEDVALILAITVCVDAMAHRLDA
jgi:uncharacterized protein YxjI